MIASSINTDNLDLKPFELKLSDIRLRALARLYTDEQRLADSDTTLGFWQLKRMKSATTTMLYLFSGLGRDSDIIVNKAKELMSNIDQEIININIEEASYEQA